MKMKRVLFTLGVLLAASAASGQVIVNPLVAKLDFASVDHNAVIPVGQPGAGGPVVVSYQGMVFPVGGTGSATVTGPVIAKTLAVASPTIGSPFRLTFAQLGITNLPVCTVVAPGVCPQYFAVIAAIGPGGTAASLAADSDPFARAPLQPNPLPAAPSALKPQP